MIIHIIVGFIKQTLNKVNLTPCNTVKMNSVILDLQGFKITNNIFICKEISVVDIQSGLCKTATFKPPFPWSDLDEKSKRTARWLTKYHHNLQWYSGDIAYLDVENHIQGLLDNQIDKVYVKGSEKMVWLQKIIHIKIINLEELNCPSLRELQVEDAIVCHPHILNCVTRNVKILRQWFNQKFNAFEAFKIFHGHGNLDFMYPEHISQLPMEFIVIYAANQINNQWYKFPASWREHEMFQQYRFSSD